MRIEPVSHEGVKNYVLDRVQSQYPLFIKLSLSMVKGHPPIDLFFLLEWWEQYKTYIARQVLPSTDSAGEWSFRFVSPQFDRCWMKVLKRKLKDATGVRHVKDAVRQKPAEQILAQLGVLEIPRSLSAHRSRSL